MQVRPECTNMSDTVRAIVDTSGYKGLARGLATTVVREVPAFGLYFGTYEWLMQLWPEYKDYNPWVFTAGGLAGVASWIPTYPIDVVKSRLQADKFGAEASYRGPMHCLKTMIEKEGYGVLVRGIGSTVIR